MKIQQISELQSFTVEEFQSDFDNLMNKVENGESFIIKDGNKSVIILPANDEIIRICTEEK